MTRDNPNLDLVNIKSCTNFGQFLSSGNQILILIKAITVAKNLSYKGVQSPLKTIMKKFNFQTVFFFYKFSHYEWAYM